MCHSERMCYSYWRLCIRRLPCMARRTPFAWIRTLRVDQGGPPLQKGVCDTRGVYEEIEVQGFEQRHRWVLLKRSHGLWKLCTSHSWYLRSMRLVYSKGRLLDAAESMQRLAPPPFLKSICRKRLKLAPVDGFQGAPSLMQRSQSRSPQLLSCLQWDGFGVCTGGL